MTESFNSANKCYTDYYDTCGCRAYYYQSILGVFPGSRHFSVIGSISGINSAVKHMIELSFVILLDNSVSAVIELTDNVDVVEVYEENYDSDDRNYRYSLLNDNLKSVVLVKEYLFSRTKRVGYYPDNDSAHNAGSDRNSAARNEHEERKDYKHRCSVAREGEFIHSLVNLFVVNVLLETYEELNELNYKDNNYYNGENDRYADKRDKSENRKNAHHSGHRVSAVYIFGQIYIVNLILGVTRDYVKCADSLEEAFILKIFFNSLLVLGGKLCELFFKSFLILDNFNLNSLDIRLVSAYTGGASVKVSLSQLKLVSGDSLISACNLLIDALDTHNSADVVKVGKNAYRGAEAKLYFGYFSRLGCVSSRVIIRRIAEFVGVKHDRRHNCKDRKDCSQNDHHNRINKGHLLFVTFIHNE